MPFIEILKRSLKHRGIIIGGTLLLFFVLVAIIGPHLTIHDPIHRVRGEQLKPPSREYPLGTDTQGRDILTRLIHGTSISLTVGLIAVGVGAVAGTVLGMVAGYAGGWVDHLIGRIIDIMLAFPGILLALLIILILGPGLENVMIAVGISRIPAFARLVRGSVLSTKETDYVVAARAAGAGDISIMFRHILPNVFAPLLVYATLGVGTAILAAASLGYLGLGAQPPTPEWGLMLSQSRDYIRYAPWTTTSPGVAIMLVVIAVNTMGDGLRDVLDPRLRGGG